MTQSTHYHRKTKAIANRLSRVEGHVRSVKGMVEEGRDCSDVLIQLAAVRSALDQVGRIVLEDHVESCLLSAARDGSADQVWADLKKAFAVYF